MILDSDNNEFKVCLKIKSSISLLTNIPIKCQEACQSSVKKIFNHMLKVCQSNVVVSWLQVLTNFSMTANQVANSWIDITDAHSSSIEESKPRIIAKKT